MRRRRILVLALALLPAVVAAQSPPRPLEVPYRQFQLANGLNVILHRDTSVPIVAVNVWYHVGSANERPGRTGFAHLFEHLMFEGSKNVKEGEFDTLLEAAGGNNNGSTTNDRTNYVIDVPSNALELALYLESDRMGYLLDTMSPAARGRPARRGEERAPPELREPALRHGVDRAGQDAVAGRPSLQLADDRLHGRPHGRQPRRRGAVLQEVLRAQQRQPGDRRRHRLRHARRRWSRSGSARSRKAPTSSRSRRRRRCSRA